MSENKNRQIAPSGGFFSGLTNRVRLIIRLVGDPRVNPLIKLLPIGSLIYMVIPDLAIGPIDDAAIIWLGTYLFVELCPPEIVEEHLRTLTAGASPLQSDPLDNKEEIVDAEFWEDKKD